METKTVVFKFDGDKVNTQAFGKDFISLLNDVYQLVEMCSNEEPCILSIENNCIMIKVACSVLTALFVNAPELNVIKNFEKYNQAIKGINRCLCSHNASLEFKDECAQKLYRFDKEHGLPYIEDLKPERIRTHMAIYGELVDIGGVNPNAHIRSNAFKDVVKVNITHNIARQLAPKLYDFVGITAKVEICDGKFLSGEALTVLEYAPLPIEQWLQINEKTGAASAFDGVDVDAFIAEQRI